CTLIVGTTRGLSYW
nr:immunoglobulin heavy chain junction region [Macaca mulatta]MOW32643.1 immunoglobulin heavy chain junction region [Macaca mulatta]MOW33195.1 immunoglobulin heavy chain junction region [Macaca mulatta]